MITIVGLGVGKGDLTLDAMAALTGGARVLLRTARTPAAELLREKGVPFTSLDEIYERMEDYDQVNAAIARAVITAAEEGDAVFGVLGGAGLMDASVKAVQCAARQKGIKVRVIPGVGLYERAAGMAGGLENACILAAIDVEGALIDVRRPLVVCEITNRLLASGCKLRLLEYYPAQWRAFLDGEEIALEELDRKEGYDHLTSLVVPPLELMEAERYDFHHLEEIVSRLRAPGGCPWDREQTHRSMKADLIEEAWEVLDAIDSDDPYRLADELGDLLLHVAMHACIGEEHGDFDARDVLFAVCNKMITRHPHVFADAEANTSEEVLRAWDKIKMGEKSLGTVTEAMRDIPRSYPALMRAAKVQKKARNVGFDWDDPRQAMDKVAEEVEEVLAVMDQPERFGEEAGDLLFAVVNVCRLMKAPPELALDGATEKFIRRFSYIEEQAGKRGQALEAMSLKQMDALWDEAKALERKKA